MPGIHKISPVREKGEKDLQKRLSFELVVKERGSDG